MSEIKVTAAAGKKVFIFATSNLMDAEEIAEIQRNIADGINKGVVFIGGTVKFLGCFDITGKEKGE